MSPAPVYTTQNMQDQSYPLQEAVEPVSSAFATAPSRWPLVTMSVRIGAGMAGVGVQVTKTALGTTTIVALFTAGAAASATGSASSSAARWSRSARSRRRPARRIKRTSTSRGSMHCRRARSRCRATASGRMAARLNRMRRSTLP